MAGDGIYRFSTCRPGSRIRADLYTAKKMAGRGARGFRDFSRLPPAQENRGQPADPTQLKFVVHGRQSIFGEGT
jgi:hypothetical protein